MSDIYTFTKRLIYLPHNDYGQALVHPIHLKTSAIDKLASKQDLAPKVAEYIASIRPDPNSRHVLINALGAGEHWGSNKNGDYFPEKALTHKGEDFGYETFLKAGAYKHHINKDITKSAGSVVLSEYNPEMHRVELIVKFAMDKDPDLIQMVDQGHLFPVSMGCKVPSDSCSICGHESKTTSDYCDDLKYHMNEIMSDGKIACAINERPKFFDISRVIVGADRTARSYGKIASADSYPTWFFMPSGDLAEKLGDVKDAAINKQITTVAEPINEEKALSQFLASKSLLERSDERNHIDSQDLKKAASVDIDRTLSTFSSLGIRLNPSEFQYLMLTKMGKGDLADSLYKIGCAFTPSDKDNKTYGAYVDLSIDNVDSFVLKIASKYLKSRSVRYPFVVERVMSLKTAGQFAKKASFPISIPALDTITGLYSVYLEKLASFGPSGLVNAEKCIPEVQYILSGESLNPFYSRSATENEKLAEETTNDTVKDFVIGSLLSPKYKPSLDVVRSTDPSHWKLASNLDALTPTRISRLHPDTSAWVTVLTVNSVNRG